jgi:hypothetical protein
MANSAGWVSAGRISGVRYFPDGEFLLHRTPNKLVSFAWSKTHRIMGLAMPREGSWLVTPHPRGFTGVQREEGRRREPSWKIESSRIMGCSKSPRTVLPWTSGSVRHAIAVLAPSDRDVRR